MGGGYLARWFSLPPLADPEEEEEERDRGDDGEARAAVGRIGVHGRSGVGPGRDNGHGLGSAGPLRWRVDIGYLPCLSV